MSKILCLFFAALLSACAASPQRDAGFTCTEVTPVESVIAGHKLMQFPCTRWERKPDEQIKKPDTLYYRNLG